MDGQVRKKLEMAAMVWAFLRSLPSMGAAFLNAVERLGELLARSDVLVAMQRDGLIAARASSGRRRELREGLQVLLRHLVRVGMLAAKGRADLGEQFRLPSSSAPHLVFITAAKGMLAKAEELKDALVAAGMSETLIDDLRKEVAEFESTSESSRDARRNHVQARAELHEVTGAIMERIRLIDALVRYKFRKDPEMVTAWESASHVPGPSRAKVAGEGEAPPSTGAASAPAA